MNAVRIINSEWQVDKGLIVFLGEDGTRMCLPIAGLGPLATMGRRVMSGAQAASEKPIGGWKPIYFSPANTFRVDTMSTPQGDVCVLQVDPETDGELQLGIRSAETIRMLGQALLEAAERLSLRGQSMN